MLTERNGLKRIEATQPNHTIGNANRPISLAMDDLEDISRFTEMNGDGSPDK